MLAFAGNAMAAGFWYLDRGVSNFARGGANMVAPTDPIGVYNNPASLAGLRGLQLMVDGNLVFENRTYHRQSDYLSANGRAYETPPADADPNDPNWVDYDIVRNQEYTLVPSPGGFAAYNLAEFGIEALTVGAGVWGPLRMDRLWESDGAQRYTETESRNKQVQYGIAAAYELPWYGLRIGVTGMLVDQIVDTRMALNASAYSSYPEARDYDFDIHLQAKDPLTPSAVFGLSAEPLKQLQVALSYQLERAVDARGTVSLSPQYGLNGLVTVEGDGMNLRLRLPGILRAGARYEAADKTYDIEVAFVWERWSSHRGILFVPDNIRLVTALNTIDIGEVEVGKPMHDSFSVRLGGAYTLMPELLKIRAGVYYESGSAKNRFTDVSSYDPNKIGGALGARVEIPGGLWLDAAFGYTYWMKREIAQSQVKLTDASTNPATELWPTANGVYSNAQTVVMLALGGSFDI